MTIRNWWGGKNFRNEIFQILPWGSQKNFNVLRLQAAISPHYSAMIADRRKFNSKWSLYGMSIVAIFTVWICVLYGLYKKRTPRFFAYVVCQWHTPTMYDNSPDGAIIYILYTAEDPRLKRGFEGHGERVARAHNGGLGAEPPSGVQGQSPWSAPGQGVRGEAP